MIKSYCLAFPFRFHPERRYSHSWHRVRSKDIEQKGKQWNGLFSQLPVSLPNERCLSILHLRDARRTKPWESNTRVRKVQYSDARQAVLSWWVSKGTVLILAKISETCFLIICSCRCILVARRKNINTTITITSSVESQFRPKSEPWARGSFFSSMPGRSLGQDSKRDSILKLVRN